MPKINLSAATWHNLGNFSWIALCAIGLFLTMRFAPLNLSLTVFLLVAVWIINVVLKAAVGFFSGTAFADLSFTAFVFAGTRAIPFLSPTPRQTALSDDMVYLIMMALFLGVLWALNLFWIKGLRDNSGDTPGDRNSRRIINGGSLILALGSVSAVLYSQFASLM
jgi:hypothetical protein